MARWIGPDGAVYASEIEAEKRLEIRQAATDEGVENVVLVEALEDATNLPDACCDGIFLRKVYHHVKAPEAMTADIRRSLKAGGRVAIIDFRPRWHRLLPKPDGLPDSRTGHGVQPDQVEEEMEAAGFRRVERIDDWWGRNYCLVFEPDED